MRRITALALRFPVGYVREVRALGESAAALYCLHLSLQVKQMNERQYRLFFPVGYAADKHEGASALRLEGR